MQQRQSEVGLRKARRGQSSTKTGTVLLCLRQVTVSLAGHSPVSEDRSQKRSRKTESRGGRKLSNKEKVES